MRIKTKFRLSVECLKSCLQISYVVPAQISYAKNIISKLSTASAHCCILKSMKFFVTPLFDGLGCCSQTVVVNLAMVLKRSKLTPAALPAKYRVSQKGLTELFYLSPNSFLSSCCTNTHFSIRMGLCLGCQQKVWEDWAGLVDLEEEG